jgi:hypothetical protein
VHSRESKNCFKTPLKKTQNPDSAAAERRQNQGFGWVHLSFASGAGFAHATRKTEFGNLQKWDALFWFLGQYLSLSNWSFDYFLNSAAKRSRRERFAANLILAPIFPETLTESAFREKSAQFNQKSSMQCNAIIKTNRSFV